MTARATAGGTGTMPGFVLVDDMTARGFEPFALTRPAGELRAGGALIRHRWMQALGLPCIGFLGAPHLASFAEFDAPPMVRGMLPAGTIVVNARCAPQLRRAAAGAHASWLCEGRVAAVRLREPLDPESLDDRGVDALFSQPATLSATSARLEGWWFDGAWDLVRHLSAMLAADALAMLPATGAQVPEALTVLGTHPVHVEAGAQVEPMVVADATAGPVLVRAGALVQSFTRLVGPCIIGEHAVVSGGRVAACSVGERCKVNGELNSVILIGHANKGHDGFVGHSVIGRWANLGAGTITSNLKNSYGEVMLRMPAGDRATGMQFLGSLIGDHVKTGIGARLTTGCVLGAGANVFGSAMPPKTVPPFAWGDGRAVGGEVPSFALDRFLVVAARVMGRRQVELGEAGAAQLAAAHQRAHEAAYRAAWLRAGAGTDA
jgi:UDP-N-acetylglucosamine diphosphorylase/glucosamine-1-phosphate N-acetyltransferase